MISILIAIGNYVGNIVTGGAVPPPPVDFIILENGVDFMIDESGNNLIIE